MKQGQLLGVRGALLRPCGLPHGGRVSQTQRGSSCWCLHTHFLTGKGESAPPLGAGETEINLIGSLTSKEEGWSQDHWAGQTPQSGATGEGEVPRAPGHSGGAAS